MNSIGYSGWHPAALSSDLPAGIVIPAWSPNGEIALWRGQSGTVTASADRCPHRGMRLSHGFVRGDALACIYHGWSFGQDGGCQRIPAHPDLEPPKTINTKNQFVKEIDGIIWISGEELPDPPPSAAGYEPLRSITIDADIPALKTVAEMTADDAGFWNATIGGVAVKFLATAQSVKQTLLHILIAETADPHTRVAVSRGVETLRKLAEATKSNGEQA